MTVLVGDDDVYGEDGHADVKHSCVHEKLKLLRLVQGNDASRRDIHIFRSRKPATVAVRFCTCRLQQQEVCRYAQDVHNLISLHILTNSWPHPFQSFTLQGLLFSH